MTLTTSANTVKTNGKSNRIKGSKNTTHYSMNSKYLHITKDRNQIPLKCQENKEEKYHSVCTQNSHLFFNRKSFCLSRISLNLEL